MKASPDRQPVFNIPTCLVVLLVVLIGLHALRMVLPDARDADLLVRFSFVPGRFSYLWDPSGVMARLSLLHLDEPDGLRQMQVARFFIGNGSVQPWTVLTYALLHGSWSHVGLNSIWLLAFGTPVARRFGPARFLAFLSLGAIAGALAHYAVFAFDFAPLIGISAAVSACMAATTRFMFQPGRQVSLAGAGEQSLVRGPSVPLRRVLWDRRAAVFIAVWFLTNLFTGLGASTLGLSEAPIAWQAHIGGFLFGLLCFAAFDPVRADLPDPVPPTDGIQDPA